MPVISSSTTTVDIATSAYLPGSASLSGTADGIDTTASGLMIQVEGQIAVEQGGIDAGVASAGAGNYVVEVEAPGAVHGDISGVRVAGEGNLIANFGTISGAFGVVATYATGGPLAASCDLENHGTISGSSVGVNIQSTMTINNFGYIFGANTAIVDVLNTNLQATTIDNSGIVWGKLAISLQAGSDTVVNTGTIHGDVNLYAGDDVFDSHAGNLAGAVSGGDGNDTITGSRGDDTLSGDAGDDSLDGGAGADSLTGGAGDDTYVVDNSGDKVVELNGQGTDLVKASVSFNLSGEFIENITLTGTGAIHSAGNSLANAMTGNAAHNSLNGGAGNDTLDGGLGSDTLTGGTGKDIFVFDTKIGSTNLDTIADFKPGADTIELNHAIFTALSVGALSNAGFHTGTSSAAKSTSDHIVYDSANGFLYYDADGSGSAHNPVHFATVTAGLHLSAADFMVA